MLKSFRFWSFIAGIISIATCALHVVGGGPEFHVPALQSELPAAWKATFSTIWHAVTALLFFNGLFLFFAAFALRKNTLLLCLVLALNASFGALFFGYGIARLDTPWLLLQWVIFAAISICIVLAIFLRDSLHAVEEVAAGREHFAVLPGASFADTYIVHNAEFSTALEAARGAFGKAPKWIDALLRLRNFIVRPFGLVYKPPADHPNCIGFFPIYRTHKTKSCLV